MLIVGLSFYFINLTNTNDSEEINMLNKRIYDLEYKASELEDEVEDNKSTILYLESEVSSLNSSLDDIKIMYDLY